MPTVYLAGPEVFFADGRALIARKRALAQAYGFEAVAGLGDKALPSGKFERGLFISALNEDLIRASDFMIANMTPFRGISTDVGTAYEIGFMCALRRPVFGYTNDPRPYNERAAADYYDGRVAVARNGELRSETDGQLVEDHGMADNLMLDGGIAATGGTVIRPVDGRTPPADDLGVFERCLAEARHYWQNRH